MKQKGSSTLPLTNFLINFQDYLKYSHRHTTSWMQSSTKGGIASALALGTISKGETNTFSFSCVKFLLAKLTTQPQ
jgi:hypothetical protein